MASIFPIVPLLPALDRIKIVDIGAMTLGDGTESYANLIKSLPCEVIGFEPIPAECEKLNRNSKPGYTFLPHAVADGQRHTFYECNAPMTSSLFEPNTVLLTKFQNLEELTRVVKTYPVDTVRLDDVAEVSGCDFLKIDVQGAELLVIENARETLRTAGIVMTEFSFVPMYKGQALFSDIDIAMRAQGFLLHRTALAGRAFKPMLLNNDINATISQQLWGDAVYVRDFMTFDTLSPATLLKTAAILHENFFSCDLAAVALEAHDRQTGSALQRPYLERFGFR
jgi:FkbM family methyltransferase